MPDLAAAVDYLSSLEYRILTLEAAVAALTPAPAVTDPIIDPPSVIIEPSPDPAPAPTPEPTPEPAPVDPPDEPQPPVVVIDGGGPHAYFDALAPLAFRSYSLRDPKQLDRPKNGGYAASNSAPMGIAYDATMDAAKVTIPAFFPVGMSGLGTLAADVDAEQAQVRITDGYAPYYTARRALMLESEIAEIVTFDRATGLATVKRGQYGTTATAHAAGTLPTLSTNSVPNALRLPIGTTEDGHTYVFVIDVLWTESYLKSGLSNHKLLNLLSGTAAGQGSIWLEPNANYAGGQRTAKVAGFDPSRDIAAFQARSYNKPGGPATWSATQIDYLGPGIEAEPLTQAATFVIKPNIWTRLFIRIEQRANDYDLLDMWIADETRDPVQTHTQLPISVRASGIETFLVEFNTSTDPFVRGDLRDLVSYVRNVVILRDPADLPALLIQPRN